MNYKLLLLAFIGVFAVKFLRAQNPPRSYAAYKTIDKIEIDGEAKEDSWQKVPESKDFIDIEGLKKPKYQTNMKMVYDEEYIYFYAKMEEPHIWATLKQRDTVIFYNNDFEIFIDPDGDTHNYMEFEMNALNTVWDLFLLKPYRESAPVLDSWDIGRLKSAVHISGTLNDASDEDEFWSVEVAIPWDVLVEASSHNEIPEEEFWRINFSRVNWDFDLNEGEYSRKKSEEGEYLPEYNWVWSPQGVINMHEPEHWGYVYFSSKNAGENDEFEIPEEEKIKWKLYKLYRKQREYLSENEKWSSSLTEIQAAIIELDGKMLKPKLENHLTGWNISIESPFTKKQYTIREDGEIVKSKLYEN